MRALGVIEEACSPRSSPIVMVPKPDGSVRFCNDFRRLNAVSEFDAYPISTQTDELVERLGESRFMSTIDLTKGYWQVPLAQADRQKMSTPLAGAYSNHKKRKSSRCVTGAWLDIISILSLISPPQLLLFQT